MKSGARTVQVSIVVALFVLSCACTSGDASRPQGTAPGLLWTGDAETGDLSQFQDTPWNTSGAGLPPDVVSEPVRNGHHVIRTRIVGKGSPEGICCGSRSELVPKLDEIHPGDDLWFGFSALLEVGFPVGSAWQTIGQWHQDTAGSPPLEISVQDGHYRLSGGYGHPDKPMPFDKPLAPAVPGTWVDWLIHIKFSPDPAVGYAEIWQDGQLVLPRFHPDSGTMYPTTSGQPAVYLKTGYYRDADISTPGTVYYDDWKVGTTRVAVARQGD
jgi:hypothetical protein